DPVHCSSAGILRADHPLALGRYRAAGNRGPRALKRFMLFRPLGGSYRHILEVELAAHMSEQAEADLPLMQAVAARDPRAQATVAVRLAPRVRRLCKLLCRSDADADAAAQVALIEILRSASTFRVASSLEHWADRIAARVAVRAARRSRTEQGFLRRW